MDKATDIEAAQREVGSLLRLYWEEARYNTPEEFEEDDEAEIRALCAALHDESPDNAVSSTCLALLELGKLRAHLNGEFSLGYDHFEDMYELPAGLDEDDEQGRSLAAAVVQAAQRTLALQETSNIAAFVLACALHWLGDQSAAAEAYREAFRLDPYDHIAKIRIEQIEQIELPAQPKGLVTHHPHGFHLLRMTHLMGHSGSTNGWVWLLSDSPAVRSTVDGYLDEWLDDYVSGLDDDFSVSTHVPGTASDGYDLREVLERTAEGRPFIDWSKVPLPELGPDPLPVGQPIRWDGQFHFHGGTEHADY
ncbi:hypothetical protein AB0A73_11680 [Glycomyces sp. NPDC047369]